MNKLRLELLREYGFGKRILDLCCGTGSFFLPTTQWAENVFGIDFSWTMVSRLRDSLDSGSEIANTGIVQGDAQALPFEADTFDLVFSFSSLYYIPDPKKYLGEISRVLRDHGAIIPGHS